MVRGQDGWRTKLGQSRIGALEQGVSATIGSSVRLRMVTNIGNKDVVCSGLLLSCRGLN